MTASVPRFEAETFVRVTENATGDYVQVGPDRDGLDLIELRAFCGGGEVGSITMVREQAAQVARAILSLCGQEVQS